LKKKNNFFPEKKVPQVPQIEYSLCIPTILVVFFNFEKYHTTTTNEEIRGKKVPHEAPQNCGRIVFFATILPQL